jgi:hypothetical protein
MGLHKKAVRLSHDLCPPFVELGNYNLMLLRYEL